MSGLLADDYLRILHDEASLLSSTDKDRQQKCFLPAEKVALLCAEVIRHRANAAKVSLALPVGTQVSKVGGDYQFDGVVVAAFTKKSGQVRFVVEDDRGVLHIFSKKNLARKG